MHKLAITFWYQDPTDYDDQGAETVLVPIHNFQPEFNEPHTAMLTIPAGAAWDEIKSRYPGHDLELINRSVAYPCFELPDANVAINQALEILYSIETEYLGQELVRKIYAACDALCLGLNPRGKA